jgi:hypothetical protein
MFSAVMISPEVLLAQSNEAPARSRRDAQNPSDVAEASERHGIHFAGQRHGHASAGVHLLDDKRHAPV